jgi:hypothetical protein
MNGSLRVNPNEERNRTDLFVPIGKQNYELIELQ